MEGALTTGGVGPLLLGDPDVKVLAGSDGVSDVKGGSFAQWKPCPMRLATKKTPQ